MNANQCQSCGYRFPDPESLRRHTDEGGGCPEETPREEAKS